MNDTPINDHTIDISPRPLVTVQWLESNLDVVSKNAISIVDGSWHMPADKRDARAEYLSAHIPGAVYLNIDEISAPSNLPHMLPSETQFAAQVGKLGLHPNRKTVVYDTQGLFSAARVWWMLNVFGFKDVVVLDGGLPAWQKAEYETQSGDVEVTETEFRAVLEKDLVADSGQVLHASEHADAVVLDARSEARFQGEAAEPRAGLRSGHIPGSCSLPFSMLVEDGRLRSNEELAAIFKKVGLPADKPVITSCGSGVTAAVLTLGLNCIGEKRTMLYDGSWTEWGGDIDLPIA